MSIHDATSVASAAAVSSTSSVKKVARSFTNTTIAKKLLQMNRKCYKCYYAKSYDQLPSDDISDLSPELISHYSGPDSGINDISLVPFRQSLPANKIKAEEPPSSSSTQQASDPTAPPQKPTENPPPPPRPNNVDCWDSLEKSGIDRFNVYHHRAYGIACSLYENNPNTNTTVGDPVADVFAILTRKNSSIMVLADGVNWGPRSRLAARCAVRACVNHVDKHMFHYENNPPATTHDIFKIMCRSFDAAQELILRKKGTMTTLCCSVVVKLRDYYSSNSVLNQTWAVCTLSIGDSTAYVFNRTKGVFELTSGARNLNNDRDMRNVGGALGHVYGNKPDVSNLNYSLMYIRSNDIVFLVSDGVSDNLDPIVSQTARKSAQSIEVSESNKIQQQQIVPNKNGLKLNRCASQSHKNLNKNAMFGSLANEAKLDGDKQTISVDDQNVQLSSLPEMSPYERYVCSLAHINEILVRNRTLEENLSAQETCGILIEHVMRLTANKRDILENGLLEAANIENDAERAKYQAALRERAHRLRGKLDHASIVAYEVGQF